jgi:hypothetical protein
VCLLCLVALTKEEGSNYLFLRWKHRSNEQGIWRVQSSISSKSIYSIEASRLALVKAESIFLLRTSGCFGTSRGSSRHSSSTTPPHAGSSSTTPPCAGSSSTTPPRAGSSSTTSPPLRDRVP